MNADAIAQGLSAFQPETVAFAPVAPLAELGAAVVDSAGAAVVDGDVSELAPFELLEHAASAIAAKAATATNRILDVSIDNLSKSYSPPQYGRHARRVHHELRSLSARMLRSCPK